MTPKQRAKIYRRAAEGVFDGGFTFACQALSQLKDGDWFNDPTEEDFPEFYLFEPSDNSYAWWDTDIEGDESRILALLLCEQMCINP